MHLQPSRTFLQDKKVNWDQHCRSTLPSKARIRPAKGLTVVHLAACETIGVRNILVVLHAHVRSAWVHAVGHPAGAAHTSILRRLADLVIF